MNIEIKGLIAALAAGAAVVGASFGLSAIMVARSSQAPYQTRGAARQADQQRMSTSMETDKQRMTALMGADKRKMIASMEQAQLVQGRQFFTQSCASCHGANGQGAFGPAVRGEKKSDAQVAAIITAGVKGRMPAFGSKYNGQQTQALVAYVRSLQ